jgi:hypothetical protein
LAVKKCAFATISTAKTHPEWVSDEPGPWAIQERATMDSRMDWIATLADKLLELVAVWLIKLIHPALRTASTDANEYKEQRFTWQHPRPFSESK